MIDHIIHNLRALTNAIKGTSNATADDQLQAIAKLKDIFREWARNDTSPTGGPTTTPACTPPAHQAQRPRPHSPDAPQPRVTVPTEQESPRVGSPSQQWTLVQPRRTAPPTELPIAQRTRSHTTQQTTNAFAALATDDEDDTQTVATQLRATTTRPANALTVPSLAHTALALPVLDEETGDTLGHRQLRRHPKYKDTWDKSYADELGWLCQGVGTSAADPTKPRVAGTDTFKPIAYDDIPHERRHEVTYTKVVCEVRPQKEDPNRTRITIGGNRIVYPGDCGTKTGSLELVKILINSVLSRPSAKFASFDLKNLYLGTPLDRPEYVRIKIEDIPSEFIIEYNLHDFTHNGWIYFEITKGVYGLKQSGKLANDLLTARLHKHGYYQCTTTPGLWRHTWRSLIFILIVDDFGIEYCERRHADHLLAALQQDYTVTTDWAGTKFAGIDLTWNYKLRMCRLSMNGYIAVLLLKYNHTPPRKPQHSPHKHRDITYGAKTQLTPEEDTSPPLDAAGVKRIQGIIGSLLYYARAVDNKLLTTLSAIGAQQAKATENTRDAVDQMLDYVSTYPTDGTTYRASDMILAAHSDASFLTEPGSRSRAGAYIFLSDNDPIPRVNGPILSIAQIIKFVMASAAEAELAALYITARDMVPMRNTLAEMGWPQPKSPIQTDNSTAVGFVNDTIITRRIKMICMRIHWLRCRESQGQFRFYWDKGANNLADYNTKHHPPAYHLAHRITHAG